MIERIVTILKTFFFAIIFLFHFLGVSFAVDQVSEVTIYFGSLIEDGLMQRDEESGEFTGFEAEFLFELGKRVGFVPKIIILDAFSELFPKIYSGEIDAGLSHIVISKKRKGLVDFSFPYLVSGMSVLSVNDPGFSPWMMFKILMNPKIWLTIGIFLLMIIFLRLLCYYFFERKGSLWNYHNQALSFHFAPFFFKAILYSVTAKDSHRYLMPEHANSAHIFSKIVLIPIWIFSFLVTALIVSYVSSHVALLSVQNHISNLDELRRFPVAAIKNSRGHMYLQEHRYKTIKLYDSLDQVYEALANRHVRGFVFGHEGILSLQRKLQSKNIESRLLANKMFEEFYGIAFNKVFYRKNEDILSKINLEIIRMIEDGTLSKMKHKWL